MASHLSIDGVEQAPLDDYTANQIRQMDEYKSADIDCMARVELAHEDMIRKVNRRIRQLRRERFFRRLRVWLTSP